MIKRPPKRTVWNKRAQGCGVTSVKTDEPVALVNFVDDLVGYVYLGAGLVLDVQRVDDRFSRPLLLQLPQNHHVLRYNVERDDDRLAHDRRRRAAQQTLHLVVSDAGVDVRGVANVLVRRDVEDAREDLDRVDPEAFIEAGHAFVPQYLAVGVERSFVDDVVLLDLDPRLYDREGV